MIRESRNGLRPVTVNAYGKEIQGYLLYIGQEGSLEEGIGICAVIELLDGGVTEYDVCKIQFDDIEKSK
jgi:hypothetical protein